MHKFLWLVGFALVTQTVCKRRSLQELKVGQDLAATELTNETELERLKNERNELIEKLESIAAEDARVIADLMLERDELNARKSSVEVEIAQLQKEVAAATSPEEKTKIEAKLSETVNNRADLLEQLQKNADETITRMKKMDMISEEIRKANSQISELSDRIQRLEELLATERARIEEIAPPKPAVSGGSMTSQPAPTPAPTPTPTPTPGATPAPTPTPPAQGTVSQQAWQILRLNVDGSTACFEFGSAQSGSSLLGLPCVTPAPVRQLFKQEFFGSNFLLVDQRSQMCIRLDTAAPNQGTARLLLGACKRGGDMNELWTFGGSNSTGTEFQLRSVKTGNCILVGDDGKVVQTACPQSTVLRSIP